MNVRQRLHALHTRRLLTPEGMTEGTVIIDGETILDLAIGRLPPRLSEDHWETEDLGDAVIMSGIVDSHVHINEPGRTEWEGFTHATHAAAAGGITTLVDMPLNSSPVTTTVQALDAKRQAATGQLWTDCGFYGGLVAGGGQELEALLAAGICGLKVFLIDSGIAEFPPVDERDLASAMALLALHQCPLLAHAELSSDPPTPSNHPTHYNEYLNSRPPHWEVDAIALLIRLCRETGCPVHVVHLATAAALPLIRDARQEGLPITVETCPHYLFFTAEEIANGDTRLKCAPPIRGAEDRQALWAALGIGQIDLIASDHSPAPPDLKKLHSGNFATAWGGIASLQHSLPVTWTAARKQGFDLVDLSRWMAREPARLAGLDDRKGSLAPGKDADLVVWHPEQTFRVERQHLQSRHPVTPYEDRILHGFVARTVLRGQTIFENPLSSAHPATFSATPLGRILHRNAVIKNCGT